MLFWGERSSGSGSTTKSGLPSAKVQGLKRIYFSKITGDLHLASSLLNACYTSGINHHKTENLMDSSTSLVNIWHFLHLYFNHDSNNERQHFHINTLGYYLRLFKRNDLTYNVIKKLVIGAFLLWTK